MTALLLQRRECGRMSDHPSSRNPMRSVSAKSPRPSSASARLVTDGPRRAGRLAWRTRRCGATTETHSRRSSRHRVRRLRRAAIASSLCGISKRFARPRLAHGRRNTAPLTPHDDHSSRAGSAPARRCGRYLPDSRGGGAPPSPREVRPCSSRCSPGKRRVPSPSGSIMLSVDLHAVPS